MKETFGSFFFFNFPFELRFISLSQRHLLIVPETSLVSWLVIWSLSNNPGLLYAEKTNDCHVQTIERRKKKIMRKEKENRNWPTKGHNDIKTRIKRYQVEWRGNVGSYK